MLLSSYPNMCLTNPVKITKISGNVATAFDSKNKVKKVNISPIQGLKVNNWILASANIAIKKITAKEAAEIKKLLKNI